CASHEERSGGRCSERERGVVLSRSGTRGALTKSLRPLRGLRPFQCAKGYGWRLRPWPPRCALRAARCAPRAGSASACYAASRRVGGAREARLLPRSARRVAWAKREWNRERIAGLGESDDLKGLSMSEDTWSAVESYFDGQLI